jgi:hypothetical protein
VQPAAPSASTAIEAIRLIMSAPVPGVATVHPAGESVQLAGD